MRRKKNNITKISLLFIILLLTLGSLGYSYGAWYDTITVDGTVTTGDWSCEEEDETAWARMYNDSEDFTYEFPGNNWATYVIHKPTCSPETFYFFAGQHIYVGELIVWKDCDYLYLEYSLDDVTMSESHLHIGLSLDDFPKQGVNPPPGQFDYKEEFDPKVNGYTYTIDWDDSWNDQDLYIGAHAVVWISSGDCLPCNYEC